jgi:hypothetical protein
VKIRLLVDRGQLEVFGNDGRTVVSDNVPFDSAVASQGIRLYASGGSVSLVSLSFSRIASTWEPAPAGTAPNNAVASTARQDKCVDRDVASGRVQLWDCLGNTQQSWELDGLGRLSTGGFCAEVPPGQLSNFTLVHVAPCTSADNQRWRQGNFGSLVNHASGRCLDLPDADFSNGRQLQIYDCVGTRNQSWVGPTHAAGTS